ncbi:MAG: hypothetical protein CSYNP_03093 [Syntrophus sp. SKADARSKE-3]|nr:hypothetical protein [Syntrophus sp. SKADARSKE-3]
MGVSIFVNLSNNRKMLLFHKVRDQGKITPELYQMLIGTVTEYIERGLSDFEYRFTELMVTGEIRGIETDIIILLSLSSDQKVKFIRRLIDEGLMKKSQLSVLRSRLTEAFDETIKRFLFDFDAGKLTD